MSAAEHRAIISQGVIIGAACVGVSVGVLQPLAEKVSRVENQLQIARQISAQSESAVSEAPKWQKIEQKCDEFETWLAEHSSPAMEQAILHEKINTIASRIGVQVDRMEPRELRENARGRSRGGADPNAPQSVKFKAAVGYTMDVVGTYESIAEFVDALSHETGLSRLLQLRMAPYLTEKGELARASIETQHFAFDIPSAEQLALMQSEAPAP